MEIGDLIHIPVDKLKFLILGDYYHYENKETKKKGSGILIKIDEQNKNFKFKSTIGKNIWSRKWNDYDFYIKNTEKYKINKIFRNNNPEYKEIKREYHPLSDEIKQKLIKFTFLKNISGIYVLKLQEERYYIGEAENIYKRLIDHLINKGAKFTILYKPIAFIEYYPEKEYKKRIELENQITEEYITKYGADKVRGGKYC